MTYYDVLGLPRTATFDEIKHAYRDQIRYFHPDVFPENPEIANLKTRQLNEAYDTLSNPAKRSAYDCLLQSRAAQSNQAKKSEHVWQQNTSYKKATPPPPVYTYQRQSPKSQGKPFSYQRKHLSFLDAFGWYFALIIFFFILAIVPRLIDGASSNEQLSISSQSASVSSPVASGSSSDTDFVYLASSKGNYYHKASCYLADYQYFCTKDEVEQAGKLPCPICFDAKNTSNDLSAISGLNSDSDIERDKSSTSSSSSSASSASTKEKSDTSSSEPTSVSYIGNTSTKKFHRSTCSYLPSKSNRITFSSRQDAISDGYSPCGHCNP